MRLKQELSNKQAAEMSVQDFTRLRNGLGPKYARTIQGMVKKSNGENYTEGYIRKSLLNAEYASEPILAAAFELFKIQERKVARARMFNRRQAKAS